MSIIEQQNNTGLYQDMNKALTEAANAASREGTEELGPKAKETLNNKITSLGEKVFLRKNWDGTHAAFVVVKTSNLEDLEKIVLVANKEAKEKLARLKTYAESIEEKSEFKTDKKYEAAREFMEDNKCDYFTYLTRSKAGSENGNIELVEFGLYHLDFAREPEMTQFKRMVVSKDPSETPKIVIAGHHHDQLQWFVNGKIPDDCSEWELSDEQQKIFLEKFKQSVKVDDDFSHKWIPEKNATIKLIINNNEINISRVQFIIVDDSGEHIILGKTHENNRKMLLDLDPNRPMYEVKYCGGTVNLEDLETGQKEESH